MITHTRRDMLQLAACGGAALLGACAPIRNGPPSSGATATAAQQPRTGGKLLVGRSQEIIDLDGHRPDVAALSTLYGTVYDRLIDYDDQLNPLPMLAESWEFSTDSTQLTVHLRKGVTFHNGREFTADDARWNFERIKDPKVVAGQWTPYTTLWQSIDTPDRYTLRFNMNPPRIWLLDMFVGFNMLDRESSETTPINTPVGTGPFSFVEWRQGQAIRFKKNPNYWRAGRPYLDEVEVQFTPEQQTAITSFEAGATDSLSDPTIVDYQRLKTDASVGAIAVPAQWYSLAINPGSHPALGDKRVRQALNIAIDRQRFVTTMLAGLSDPVNLPWPSYSEAYEPQKQAVTAFDLNRAQTLLGDAGVSSAEFDLIWRSSESESAQFAQMWQADLAKIGVKLNLKPLEFGAYTAATNANQFQIYVSPNARAQYHPVTRLYYGNPRILVVDPALVEQVAGETDPAKRKALYSQINDLALDASIDMCSGLFPRITLYNANKVVGLQRHLNNATLYADTWLNS